MTTLTWQTLLLLAVTYVAGCCIGCLARRAAWRRRAQPALQKAAQSVSVSPVGMATQALPDRSEAAVPAAANRSAAGAPIQAGEPFRRADAATASTSGAMPGVAGPAARFERALEAGGAVKAQPVVPGASVGDDLKRVRAIDAALETQLKAMGTSTFAAMAQWTAADTARVSRELGFKGRIEQENWIEQAQILAKGGDTRYSQRLARGEAAAARPIGDEGEPRPAVMPLAPAAAGEPAVRAPERTVTSRAVDSPNVSERAAFADSGRRETEAPPAVASRGQEDLQRISGINMEIEALLNRQGVMRYSQIASWSPTDTGRFDGLLGQAGRVARENWIEQAQILARGGDTAYSRDYDRRMAGTHVQVESESAAKASRASELAALRSVRSEAYRGEADTPVAHRGQPAAPDDLKRIRGIGVLIERGLNSLGVTTYAQIANWSATDIARIGTTLDLKDRTIAENWVEQARLLAGEAGASRGRRRSPEEQQGDEPAAAVAEASPISQDAESPAGEAVKTGELMALRSVRSEAYRPGGPGEATRGGGGPDDLKRIRGVGLLIEKKLNSLGVATYEQIANWTAADIDRVSQVLDFKGRIERENWVEQARILASGGQTEFSRRLDRGTAAAGGHV